MNRENWLKNIEGAVFDLDGTLLDSSWVWEKVDEKFLGDRGFQVPDDYVDEISPLGAERAAVYTIERFGLNEDKDDIVREWIEMAKKEYATEVVCKPYAKEFLEELHKLNIKMAVATSSDRELFMKTLEREGILKYFQKIVTVDEVERGKGYPDIYEEAARRIKVNPHKCLVFEEQEHHLESLMLWQSSMKSRNITGKKSRVYQSIALMIIKNYCRSSDKKL